MESFHIYNSDNIPREEDENLPFYGGSSNSTRTAIIAEGVRGHLVYCFVRHQSLGR